MIENVKSKLKIIILGVLIIVSFQIDCTIPQKQNLTWERYNEVKFDELKSKYEGYLSFNEDNTIRIYSPANAFRCELLTTGKYEKITEEEISVLSAKYKSDMSEDQVRQTYKNKICLKTDKNSEWFCFQESIYYDLVALKPGTPVSVLFQFAGSTNVNSHPHLIFAVMGWSE